MLVCVLVVVVVVTWSVVSGSGSGSGSSSSQIKMTESITQKLDTRDTVSWLMQVSSYTCSCGNAASADTTAHYKVKQKYIGIFRTNWGVLNKLTSAS